VLPMDCRIPLRPSELEKVVFPMSEPVLNWAKVILGKNTNKMRSLMVTSLPRLEPIPSFSRSQDIGNTCIDR
jgi:hypothetical protein